MFLVTRLGDFFIAWQDVGLAVYMASSARILVISWVGREEDVKKNDVMVGDAGQLLLLAVKKYTLSTECPYCIMDHP